MSGDRKYCKGCRDDFYNAGNNPLGVQECWSLKNAKVVVKLRIGHWTPQDSRENFSKVTTNSCHYAPGKYALYTHLPLHLGGDTAEEFRS